MKRKRRKPTPAIKQAQRFIEFAKASKAGEIPADCALPSTVAEIEAGRPPETRRTCRSSALVKLRRVKANEARNE